MRIIHKSLFTALSAALLVACVPDDKEDSASGEQGTSTTAEPTGGEAPTTGTTGEEEETSTGDATTGAVEGDGCEAQCANQAACGGVADELCLADCRREGDRYAFSGAACRALFEEYTVCLGAASCEELSQPSACAEQFAALISETCTISECMDLCARHVECGLTEPGAQVACAVQCSSAIGLTAVELGEECVDLGRTALTCSTKLSCEQLTEGSGCEAEFTELETVCDD